MTEKSDVQRPQLPRPQLELLTAARAVLCLKIKPVKAKWLKDEALAGRLPHINCDGVPLFDRDTLMKALIKRAQCEALTREDTNDSTRPETRIHRGGVGGSDAGAA